MMSIQCQAEEQRAKSIGQLYKYTEHKISSASYYIGYKAGYKEA